QTMTARLPPSVGVFEPVFNGGIPYFGVDDTEGARKAVDLLLAEGHRKIAFIGDSRTRLAYTRRRMGYYTGLDAAGIPPDTMIVLEGDGTIESG
ncbi:LacI family transcriptional regulator, partial [Rhizobium ruizarguesonis]